MTASMFSGEGGFTKVVGLKEKGRLPGPAFEPYRQAMFNKPKSDLQNMQENERKQHEQTYIYENGHNDHGLGQ
jgi:hypothetical protein